MALFGYRTSVLVAKCLVALSTGNGAFGGHPDGRIKRLDFLAGIL